MSLLTQRVQLKPLAEFLRRIGISLEAGIDVRKVLTSEAERTRPPLRSRVESIRDAAARGIPLAEAMEATGDFFPRLTRELVAVGEQTGHLTEVLKQLAAHYETQVALRREFRTRLAWPMIQLVIALGVIGLLIFVMGWIQATRGQRIDILGFGLVGTPGLIVYCTIVGVLAAGCFALYRAIASGKLWAAPVQRFAMALPQIGSALRTLAVARFAWTLHLSLDAALDVKRSLALALASTHNVEFTSHRDQVLSTIERGEEINVALAKTKVFPVEFLHAVQVGEESGRLVETLAIVSRQNHEEASRALAFLARVGANAIWVLIAVFIIFMIFRIFGFYTGAIQDAAR